MKHYWETKDGDEIEISKMKTSHIKNCIAMLERNAKIGVETIYGYGYSDLDDFPTGDVEILKGKRYLDTTEYRWLVAELKKRV